MLRAVVWCATRATRRVAPTLRSLVAIGEPAPHSPACRPSGSSASALANIIFGAAFDPSLDGMIRVSVVATGMDGGAVSVMEPKPARAPLTAPPLRATPEPEPVEEPVRSYERPVFPERLNVQPAYAPEPAYASAPERVPEPIIVTPAEPARAAETAAQGDLLQLAPEPTQEPRISRPIARIVDPAVAEEGDESYLSQPYDDRRAPRAGGFLSLFGGRQRYEPAPSAPRQAVSRGGALPAEAPMEEIAADTGDDLEIPSFLRRLAN